MATQALSPRIQRTRAALIAAGLDLLAARPIDAIAIDEVVVAAGVAKGSFFNHFADKHAFAAAVAAEVRAEVEAEVAAANAARTDPVARIAGGMAVAAAYALREPRRARVLLRDQSVAAAADHPLNRGLRADIDAALAAGLLRFEAATSGIAYWLGLCQVVMILMTDARPSPAEGQARLGEMLAMGLAGLGVADAHAAAVIEQVLAGWRV
ncbi:TetR/AcrR family transcriptional regulator [Erythrobacter sp. CCH5-A1]|jgi:AcrR family transcriptional regulator|uniref:TetR/AcrR family transcriptional regulator n=1 Tax=Erythrobacter sp. CCH5-A1 TaxID=1768792 RepID=UPI0008302432|nr:TetR family transcriptional regulator [Erythrobacter sp. CCH5-A1]